MDREEAVQLAGSGHLQVEHHEIDRSLQRELVQCPLDIARLQHHDLCIQELEEETHTFPEHRVIVGVQDLYCHTSARIAQPAPESATREAERPRSSAVIFVPHRVRPGG